MRSKMCVLSLEFNKTSWLSLPGRGPTDRVRWSQPLGPPTRATTVVITFEPLKCCWCGGHSPVSWANNAIVLDYNGHLDHHIEFAAFHRHPLIETYAGIAYGAPAIVWRKRRSGWGSGAWCWNYICWRGSYHCCCGGDCWGIPFCTCCDVAAWVLVPNVFTTVFTRSSRVYLVLDCWTDPVRFHISILEWLLVEPFWSWLYPPKVNVPFSCSLSGSLFYSL